MVAQKITCPSRSDDIGNKTNSNTKRYGFFANESQDSKYFESGRIRSYTASKQSNEQQYRRSGSRRKVGNKSVLARAHHQLFRGKISPPVYLKPEPEPLFESKMFNDPDCEFFQDLVPWCLDPAKDELIQTTDSPMKYEESVHNTDTLHTPFSPRDWESFDANSPLAAGYPRALTPHDPISPNTQFDTNYLFSTDLENIKKLGQEELDINDLPIFLSQDLASEQSVDLNRCTARAPGTAAPQHTHSTEHTSSTPSTREQTQDTRNKMLFFNEDVYFGSYAGSGIPLGKEVNDDVVLSEYVVNIAPGAGGVLERLAERRAPAAAAAAAAALYLDVSQPWAGAGDLISTPEVLTCVEELEKQDSTLLIKKTTPWIIPETELPSMDEYTLQPPTPAPYAAYSPMTPKTESHVDSDDEAALLGSRRRRRVTEDSDESYKPEIEQPRRKKKKPNIKALKQKISELEGSQSQKPVRRGRPPKRRDSTVSSVYSIDDHNFSPSNTEMKYRELRDKNNEASKRSRMNRKLKELQMEQLAVELDERNQKLRVKADILEEMTKRLKDALMAAILQQ